MSIVAAALRELMAAGLSGEELVAAVERIEASSGPIRTARQERNARYYQKKASEKRLKASEPSYSDDQDATPTFPEERKVSPHPSKETQTLPSPPSATPQALSGRVAAFDAFWKAYPRKVGKDGAERAYLKALKKHPGLDNETLLPAIDAYMRFKPPDIDFCHPATWLNQGRWNDDWTDANGSRTGGNPGVRSAQRGYDAVTSAMGDLAAQWFGRGDDDPGRDGFDRGGTVIALPSPR